MHDETGTTSSEEKYQLVGNKDESLTAVTGMCEKYGLLGMDYHKEIGCWHKC